MITRRETLSIAHHRCLHATNAIKNAQQKIKNGNPTNKRKLKNAYSWKLMQQQKPTKKQDCFLILMLFTNFQMLMKLSPTEDLVAVKKVQMVAVLVVEEAEVSVAVLAELRN
jgi:hypothetical protein